VIFEVLREIAMKIADVWDVALCGLINFRRNILQPSSGELFMQLFYFEK
jgi:hypothetical protein